MLMKSRREENCMSEGSFEVRGDNQPITMIVMAVMVVMVINYECSRLLRCVCDYDDGGDDGEGREMRGYYGWRWRGGQREV